MWAKFHALSCYVTRQLGTEEEQIWLYVKGLTIDLQILSVHMDFVENSFNDVYDYVKNLEGVQRAGLAEVLAKKSQNTGNFSDSYSNGQSQ